MSYQITGNKTAPQQSKSTANATLECTETLRKLVIEIFINNI